MVGDEKQWSLSWNLNTTTFILLILKIKYTNKFKKVLKLVDVPSKGVKK